MSEVYAVLDVTSWEPAGDEQIGSKPKQWLWHPNTDERWLWKESTWNVGADGLAYLKGDDWSERVAREVGIALGVPTAEVELAARGDRVGVVSRSFLVGEEILIHGNDLLEEISLANGEALDRSAYTIDVVAAALEGVMPPIDLQDCPTAVEWFAGYLILDALVGNTDRHQWNWGVIECSEGRRLAPSFDHASCLGFLLRDGEREERLGTRDGNRTPLAFATKAPSRFAGSPHPVDVALDLLARLPPAARKHWRTALASLGEIDAIVAKVPLERMSEPSRRFAAALFAANVRRLSHRLRTMVP